MWFFAACRDPGEPPAPPTGPEHTSASHSAAADHSASPEHTGGADWPEVRCADRVPAPLVVTPHPTARAFHDVLFDEAGNLYGGFQSGLWRFPASGAGELVAAGTGDLHQLEWLPGDVIGAMADASAALERVDPATGGHFPVASGGYAVRQGPGGWFWTTDANTLGRALPGAWDRDVVIPSLPDGRPKVVAFDRDGATAFVGTAGGTGVVYTLALDVAGDPVGSPVPFATVGGGWHDAIGVDACGHVYVADTVSSALFRVDPTGVVELVAELTVDGTAHGLRWGSGVGGWRHDALYLAQPYGGDHVAEVIVGVPSADWRGGRYVVVE